MALVPDDEPVRTLVPDDAPDIPRGVGGSASAGFIRGIPVLGPAIEKAAAYGFAAPASLFTGRSIGDQAQIYLDQNRRIAEQSPISNAAGEIAGSVMSTVPAARAFPTAFGGSTMAGQIGAGAALGGADAAVRSGGDTDAMKTGAAIGAAAPIVGSVLAPAGQAVAGAWRGLRDEVPGVSRAIQAAGFKPRVNVPEAQAAIDAADAGFQSLHGMMVYPRSSLDILTDQIRQGLRGQSRSGQIGATQTHAILDTLDSLPPTPGSLHTLRKALGEIHGGDEGRSAQFARDQIDAFLGAPHNATGAIVNPRAAQAGVNPGQVLADANANYQAGMASRTINERVIDKAERDAAQANWLLPDLVAGQIMRKDAKNLLQNKTEMRYWTPEQRAILDNAMRSQSLGQGALDVWGKLSQTSRPGMGSMVAWLAANSGAGAALGGPTGAALGLGGAAANVASTGMLRSQIRHADEAIRAAAPFGQAAVAAQQNVPHVLNPTPYKPLYNSIGPRDYRNEISRLLMLQGERAATENSYAP